MTTPSQKATSKEKTYWLKKENKSNEFDYIDQNGTSHESPKGWLWDILGGCGCGSSDELADRAWKVLELFATEHMERSWDIYKDEADEILAHWMDSVELIEHGTGIGGSWLTEKGEQVYKSIKELL